MTDVHLVRDASAREVQLYEELLASYTGLAAVLGSDAPIDAAAVADAGRRAEAATADLQAVAALLRPVRLSGETVPADVRALWEASARLAEQAVAANMDLVRRGTVRRAAVQERLAQVSTGRRAVAEYRPLVVGTPGRRA